MLVLLVLVGAGYYVYTHQDQLKQVVVEQLNKSLNAEINVEDITLDLFNSFPLVDVRFSNVVCQEVVPFSNENLFSFKHIYASVTFWNIVKQDYSIEKITLDDGSIVIKTFKDGSNNYKFWKESTDSNSVNIALEKVEINHTYFKYIDHRAEVYIAFLAESLDLKGALWKSVFDADFELITEQFELQSGEISILNDASLKAKSNIRVGNDSVLFQNGNLALNKLLFNLSGRITNRGSKWNISGQKMSLSKFVALIPAYWLPQKADMQIAGDFNANLFLDINSERVSINSDLAIENGSYKNKKYPINLNNISVAAKFTNGSRSNLNTTRLTLDNLKGTTPTGSFFCDIDIKNFVSPAIDMTGELSMSTEELLALTRPGLFEKAGGHITANFTAKSKYSSFAKIQETALKQAGFTGNMKMVDGLIKFKDANFSLDKINAELVFSNKDINIKDLDITSGSSQFSATGVLREVLYFNDNRPRPTLDVALKSSLLNLHEIANWSFGTNKNTDANAEVPFDFNTTLNIDAFNWKKFEGQNLTGKISGNKLAIVGKNMAFSSNKGQVNGNLNINKNNKNLSITGNVYGIDINSLFEQFENFGQTDIVAENIHGLLTSSLYLNMGFDDNWNVVPSKINFDSDFTLVNGQLKNYEPLMSMKRYADEELLRDVHFSKLTNKLSIKNSTLIIPQMKIESNALNLELAGTHDFESNINYKIKMQLGLALKGKTKNKTGLEDWIVEENRPDEPYIWVKVGCTVDNPCVSLDQQKTKKDILKGITNEGQDWKNLKNEPIKKKDPNEGEMIFEWNEEPDTNSY